MLNIGRIDEALLGVDAVRRHRRDPGFERRLEEAVAVVPEVSAPRNHDGDEFHLSAKRPVDLPPILRRVTVQQLPSGLEIQALRDVSSFVGRVAGSLVGGKFDMDVVADHVLPEVHYVAVVGDGERGAGGARSRRPGEGLSEI